MEQLTYKDAEHVFSHSISLWWTVGGGVFHNSPSDVTTPHLWLSFLGSQMLST